MTPITLEQLPTLRPATMCIEVREGVRVDCASGSYVCGASLASCLEALGLPSIDSPTDQVWVPVDGVWTLAQGGQ